MTNSTQPHLKPIEQRDDQILVDRLYTIDEASTFLGYGSGSWLRKRIKEGSVPSSTSTAWAFPASSPTELSGIRSARFSATTKPSRGRRVRPSLSLISAASSAGKERNQP